MGVIEKQSIQDIADAIRDRNGLTTLYKPRQMDEAIRGLYKTEAVNHIFDNLTISTTAQGSSITITDADTTKQASIIEIKGTGEKRKLPIEYQEVEYIQTTGTQWINTGVAPSNDIRIKTDIEVSQTGQDKAVFGLYVIGTEATSISNAYHLTPYSSKWYYGTNGGQGSAGTYSPVVGTRYDIDFNCDSHGHILINGQNITAYDETYSGGSYSNPIIGISWRGYSAGATRKGQFKYYSFKMLNKNTNQYIRNFIPCYRKSDNVIGMYDTVGGVFYTNSGTGTFGKGADIIYENVTGDNNIVVSNKNLYNVEDTLDGQYYSSTGTITINANSFGIMIPLNASNISYSIKNNSNSNVNDYVFFFDRNMNRVSAPRWGTTVASGGNYTLRNFSTTNAVYVAISIIGISPSQKNEIQIQLEKGNQATEYIAHQGNSYRVDLGGKNLVTPQNVQTAQNVVNTLNADGSITSVGTPNTGYYNITSNANFNLPVGTYTFSINTTRQYLTALSLENESGTKESKYIRIGEKSVTFTTTEKKVKFYFWSYATNGTPVNETIKYQLEKGSQATPYSPYTDNPIELTEQDKLWNNNGTWQLNDTAITDNYLLEQLQALENIELYEDLCYVDFVGNEKADMSLLYYVDGEKILEEIRKE